MLSSGLSSIPLREYITACSPVLLLTDFGVVSVFSMTNKGAQGFPFSVGLLTIRQKENDSLRKSHTKYTGESEVLARSQGGEGKNLYQAPLSLTGSRVTEQHQHSFPGGKHASLCDSSDGE